MPKAKTTTTTAAASLGTAEVAGVTKGALMSKNWCFTVNNPLQQDAGALETAWEAGLIKYVVMGKETAPETGTPHWQGFIQMLNNCRASAIVKLLPRAHIEKAKGSAQQAAAYCRKDGDFLEKGTRPLPAGEGEKYRWELARTAAKEGRFEDIPADIYFKYHGNAHKIYAETQVVPASIKDCDFWWFYGGTGTGKSYTARQENPGYYVKNKNKWWCGYTGQVCVIIEEWDPHYEVTLGSFLKEWADHHPFCAEIKGGSMCIRPAKLIITSNYTMEECFTNPILLEPLLRRFKKRHFNQFFALPASPSTAAAADVDDDVLADVLAPGCAADAVDMDS